MAKTANINIRIDPQTKMDAEILFSCLGMSITDAINIFLKKSIMEGGLPFDVKVKNYNYESKLAIEEAQQIMNGSIESQSYSSADELFDELDRE